MDKQAVRAVSQGYTLRIGRDTQLSYGVWSGLTWTIEIPDEVYHSVFFKLFRRFNRETHKSGGNNLIRDVELAIDAYHTSDGRDKSNLPVKVQILSLVQKKKG